MSRSRYLPLLAVVAACGIVLAGCRQPSAPPADPAPAPPQAESAPIDPAPPEAPAVAVSVTTVELGTEVADGRRIAEPATRFAPDDSTLFAAVVTATEPVDASASATLGVRWLYQDGQLVDERTEALSFSGTHVTNFRVSIPDAWPAGAYTLEVSVDGELAQSLPFTVE